MFEVYYFINVFRVGRDNFGIFYTFSSVILILFNSQMKSSIIGSIFDILPTGNSGF